MSFKSLTNKFNSECRYRVTKKLSDRIHNCPYCGFTEDRDINAGRNILRLGLQSLGVSHGSLAL